ncbi:MAG: hypothetical protein AAF570_13700 [Bacteroidota bacterium]
MEFIASGDANICAALQHFYPGDLVKVFGTPSAGADFSDNQHYYHVLRKEGSYVYLEPSDLYGEAATGYLPNVDVEIVRSGRKNMLNAELGGLSFYDTHLKTSGIVAGTGPLFDLITDLNTQAHALTSGTSATINLHGRTYSATLEFEEEGCNPIAAVPELTNFTIELFSDGTGKIYYGHGNQTPPTREIDISYGDPLTFGKPGSFVVDEVTGFLVWRPSNGPCAEVQIFAPCDAAASQLKAENVLSATAMTRSDALDFLEMPLDDDGTRDNPYENGRRGRWFGTGNFTFSEDASRLADVEHSTQAGILEDFTCFSFGPQASSSEQWINSGEVTLFHAQGHPLETRDPLGIYSASAFSYGDRLPIFAATNARYNACLFESMENARDIDGDGSADFLEDSRTALAGLPGTLDDAVAHSGFQSLKLDNSGPDDLVLRPIEVDEAILQSGLRLRFWVRQQGPLTQYYNDYDDIFYLRIESGGTVLGTPVECAEIAQTGEWSLMEAIWAVSGISLGQALQPVVNYDKSSPAYRPANQLWIDDLKLQPRMSSMTCLVYDPADFKVLCQFNENHFGTFMQYNHRNEFVRKVVETQEGKKTLSEQHSHLLSN